MSSIDIMEMLKGPEMVKICAPMVRYSKLAFRALVRRYNCDICFTPMIMADSFVQSAEARANEFTTNSLDNPLIVQFAAKTATDFANAAELVAPYCQGVDLNCGCPQRWAIKDGYGSHLLNNPQLIKEIVQSVQNRISAPFTVSVKIRLLSDMRRSVELCKILQHAGVSFITVHARTPQMRKEPILMDGLKLIRDCTQLPLIANGDIKSLSDAESLYTETNYEGVMVANGILTNPGLFTGAPATTLDCIQDWLDISAIIPTNFVTMHHHLVFMLEKVLPRKEKFIFNSIQTTEEMYRFIRLYYGLEPKLTSYHGLQPINCNYAPIQRTIHNLEDISVDMNWEEPLTNLFYCDDVR